MSEYANDVLVSADWVADNLDQFQDDDSDYRLVEVDVDTEAYDEAHAPGAIGFNWGDPAPGPDHARHPLEGGLRRPASAATVSARTPRSSSTATTPTGSPPTPIGSSSTTATTTSDSSTAAASTGSTTTTRRRTRSPTSPPSTTRPPARASPSARTATTSRTLSRRTSLVDVRAPRGVLRRSARTPGLQETAQRGGHVPGAQNISWAAVTNDDGTFKDFDALESLYAEDGIDGDETTVAYCRIGERSSVAWFALHELLGYDDAVNYDGSWTEWGQPRRRPHRERRIRSTRSRTNESHDPIFFGRPHRIAVATGNHPKRFPLSV